MSPLTKEPWQTLKALYGLLCVDHVGDIDLVWRHFCFIVIRNDPTNSYSSFWAQALHCSFKVHTSHILKIHIYPSRCCLSQGLHQIFCCLTGLVVYTIIKAKLLLYKLALLWTSSRANYCTAKDIFRHHTNHRADCSSCTTDPESFTFLWLQNIDQSPICSRSRHSKSAYAKTNLIFRN